jgi:glutathione S-transferase
MQLYTYFRSSAAYRVCIVLSLKGLEWRLVPIHMLRNGGEHRGSSYRAINPQGLIPALDDGGIITQSIAVCEYLAS